MTHICYEVDKLFRVESDSILIYYTSKKWIAIRPRFIYTKPCYLPFNYKGFKLKVMEGL